MEKRRSGPGRGAAQRTSRHRDRIRSDLEGKGIHPDFSAGVAEKLEPMSAEFGTPAYVAALEGVAAAYAVVQSDREALATHGRDVDEIQRLMKGFAGELRKLEEGLRIVSAYVGRMHDKAIGEKSGRRSILH
jgi:hypothetical protein